MSLTPSQQKAKERVEAAGGIFVKPSSYLSDHHSKKYARGASDKATKRAYNTQPRVMESLHPTTEALVNQILDPETAAANGLERWPELLGLSGIYHSKNVINAAFSNDNRCSVYVHPRLSNAIFTTKGSQDILALPKKGIASICPVFQDYVQMKANIPYEVSCPIYVQGDNAALRAPNPTNATDGLYPLEFTVGGVAGAANIVNLEITFDSVQGASISGDLYLMSNAGAILATYSGTVGNTGVVTMTIPSIAYVPHTHIAIRLNSEYDYSGEIKGMFSTDAGAPGNWDTVIQNQAEHCSVSDVKDASTFFEEADKYSVISQSLLCTSQMSSLNNAGTISAARLSGPIGSQGENTFSNVYEELAALPTNSYDGPVKDGCYVWNLFDDQAGYFYKNVREGHNLDQPYLCAQFTVDAAVAASSPVRIKVNTVVQFKTTSSIFALAPSEYIGNDLPKLLHLLSLVPAAYSNGLHKKDLKRYMKKAGDTIIKVMKNPKTYSTLAKYGPMLASLLV